MSASEVKEHTILFADIAGSTRLYDQLGDEMALALVAGCIDRIHAVTEAFEGSIVKTIGDEVMCMFNQPDKAVAAAVKMHDTICSDSEMSAHKIQLRIGFHHGPVLVEVGDLYGDAVNMAARMVGQAKAGQIITTHATIALMSIEIRQNARLLDQTRVKGKQELLEIYEIPWGQPEELTMISTYMSGRMKSENGLDTYMILHYKGEQIRVNQKRPVITIGRDSNNHLVISDPRVSRIHARIELRRNKFVLVDQSTNGTYILPGNGEIVMMRRDEIVLPRKGIISLGQQVVTDSPMAISFQAF